jgi:hypothetical protein
MKIVLYETVTFKDTIKFYEMLVKSGQGDNEKLQYWLQREKQLKKEDRNRMKGQKSGKKTFGKKNIISTEKKFF